MQQLLEHSINLQIKKQQMEHLINTHFKKTTLNFTLNNLMVLYCIYQLHCHDSTPVNPEKLEDLKIFSKSYILFLTNQLVQLKYLSLQTQSKKQLITITNLGITVIKKILLQKISLFENPSTAPTFNSFSLSI